MDDSEQPRAARAGRRARAAAFSADDEGAPPAQEESSRGMGGGGGEPDGEDGPRTSAPREEASSGGGGGPPAPRRGGFNMDDSGPSGPPPPSSGFSENVPRGPRDPEIGGDAKYAGVSRRKQDQRQREEDEKAKAKNKYDELVDRAQPIDGILEIEEEGKEDLTGVVAEAPKVRINKVQNITDLDEDMQFRLPAQDDRDIDLSTLTGFLCSSEQVHEDDDVWDADMLFTNVASELHQEKERAEGVTEETQPDGI